MYNYDDRLWKRLRPVWIGGIASLIGGAVLFMMNVAMPLEDRKAYVPAHDVFGGLRLLDLRNLPFLLPVFGTFLGMLVKMYRDAVVKHRQRPTFRPENGPPRR